MHVIGTAGHVDHGKSTLVRALTGTNPDRWLEEQLRGMTLDLGFAHLRFADGVEAGIVDVPGHERFLHNMLAGAAGMELLLLVIAANEGIMPQTVEHLQILHYLNVREVIVVVTKADLLGEEDLAAACARIHAGLKGTIAAQAPVVAVSVTTGYHLDALRDSIRRALERLPARDPDAPAYMPVDRVFALPGHGTIVTGTLMQGRIRTGETLFLQPSGKAVRVRSLQSFGEKRDAVDGGTRVAVNVPSVGAREIARGEMLVAAQFAPSRNFSVRFTPLPHALALLRRRNAVRIYIGSAEILGSLLFELIPQSAIETRAQVVLRRGCVAYPGMPFVARRLSPKTLLGGGQLEGAGRFEDEPSNERSPHESSVLTVLRQGVLAARTATEIARQANLRDDSVAAALASLLERGEVLAVLRPAAYVDALGAQALLERALEVLVRQQQAEPWSMGATSLLLARALSVDESLLMRILDAFAQDGRIARRAGYFSTTDYAPALSSEQQAFFASALRMDPSNPLVPTPLAEVVAKVKQSRVSGVSKAFDTLIAKGALVKVGDELYRGEQIATVHARVETFLLANARMTMAQFRDVVGTSRKYAVPLLEWFDARGITVRSGDYRMLRATTARAQTG